MFERELKYIKTEKVRNAANYFISKLPDYFFEVPASSTGKYHPKYTTGKRGLYRHVKSAVRIAHELLEIEMYRTNYTENEKDLIILALILHDGFKSGIIKEQYTRFDHPILMANFVRNSQFESGLDENDINILADAIKSHMGEFTRDYNGVEVLEKPKTKTQKFVHMCDYLASRKFLNVEFDENDEIID